MKRVKILLISICVSFVASLSSALPSSNIDDYKMLTELYPPYNFVLNGKLSGVSIDILEEVLKDMGSKKNTESIEVNPWSRAYNEVQKKENIMIFSTTRIPEREELFKWVGPIIHTNVALFAKKKSKIIINSPQDIEKYKVGVVIDDVADLVIRGLIKDQSKILSSREVKYITLQLQSDRVNLIGFETKGLMWEITELGLNPEDYEQVFVLKESDLYFTFSKQTPNSLTNKMQISLDNIKKTDKYQEIINKYVQ